MYRVKSTDVWFNAPGVVAAYQPIAAPDPLLARYNVGNNARMAGKYTAVPGVAPTWSGAVGWTFNGSDQYLTTGFVPGTSQFTAALRFSLTLTTDTGPFGYYQPGNAYYIKPISATTKREYASGNGALTITGGAAMSGVMAISGKAGYFNGALDGTISGDVTTITYPMYIGAVSGPIIYYQHGKVQALLMSSVLLPPAHMFQYSRQMAHCERNPDWNAWARRRMYFYAPSAAAGRVGIYGRRGAVALPGGVSIRGTD